MMSDGRLTGRNSGFENRQSAIVNRISLIRILMSLSRSLSFQNSFWNAMVNRSSSIDNRELPDSNLKSSICNLSEKIDFLTLHFHRGADKGRRPPKK
jgi:hypothetical protein